MHKLLAIVVLLVASPVSWALTAQQVNMKIDYAQQSLTNSGSAKRIDSGDSEEAKAMLAKARQQLQDARDLSAKGDLAGAEGLVNEALRALPMAVRLASGNSAQRQMEVKRYHENLQQINTFRHWLEQYRINNPGVKLCINPERLDTAVRLAMETASKGDYRHANAQLKPILFQIVKQTNKSVGGTPISYALDFKNPQEEFDYELNLNKDYERLVPIAVEQRVPQPTMKMLMDRFVAKAKASQEEAIGMAEQGNHQQAVLVILRSTEEFKRALQTIGVR